MEFSFSQIQLTSLDCLPTNTDTDSFKGREDLITGLEGNIKERLFLHYFKARFFPHQN